MQNTQASSPKWYDIRANAVVHGAAKAASEKTAEVFIFGDIGESWFGDSVTAADFVKEFAAIDASSITVRINSYGGSVTDGIAIYNAIKRHPAHITTVNEGLAASIASLILMAGDTVQMAENAMLMIHAPWGGVQGNSAELRRYADMLDTWAKAMSKSYCAKSGMAEADVMALLSDGQDHWYTADEASASGFVDEMVAGVPAQARLMASFQYPRFASMPASLQALIQSPVAAATSFKGNPMTNSVVNPAAAPVAATPEQIQAAQAQGVALEAARRQSIEASFAPHKDKPGVAELLAAALADTKLAEADAGRQLLAHLGRQIEPVASVNVITVEAEADKFRNSVTASLMQRVGKANAEDVKIAQASSYRGMTLMEVAKACLVRAGINTQGMNPLTVVAQSFTQGTGDFPVILENAIRKELLASYRLKALVWRMFCKQGSVSDFRAHNRYRVGSLGNLQPKNELGNYRNVAIPDGEKSSITAATKGFIVNISREMIINDDMGAITDQAAAMGRSAARTVETDVFAALLSNGGMGPIMNDGLTLFNAAHNNMATGAISVNTFDSMKSIMAVQKDISGNDFLDLTPSIWLGPVNLEGDAKVVNASTYDPDANNKLQRANKVFGLVKEVVSSPRLTGTPFYFFADPAEAAAIEVAFLNGADEPFLDTEEAWTTDGTAMKVRLDYGIAGHDWRAAVRSSGV